MKKVLFINAAWNLYKTKSSLFLVDFLKEKGYDVEITPFYKYRGLEKINIFKKLKFITNSKKYHTIIFFQTMYNVAFMSKLQCKNVVFVPMYDHYVIPQHRQFNKMLDSKIKILNFSKTLQNRISNFLDISNYVKAGGGGM
ncbi:hypothetical protein CQA53_03835 [Helicobacter didelphidarum]|uniref:Glycosyltransferase family 1 protein n=1 Tax=Helicobacter didelphidarum TaxID=2040648 RepID=A0A3D8IP37_9HELI|nr:hypothetical protein [Helicobacter didelphidarum]RDU66361.1 hypothetical protein CQA53_03835 [Helicobacter didelphidarum]